MAFYDDSDPTIPSNEFEKFPKGEVEVMGIHSFISKDETGAPIWKEKDGRYYTMFRLRLADGTEGPPMSAGPGDLAQIVAAFASHEIAKQLPADRASTGFLLKALELINARPNRQKVYVNDQGYCRNLTGMYLPTTEFFRFSVDSIRNLDGKKDPLGFQMHQNFKQEVINVRMRVMGDMNNNRSLYDGASVSFLLENPFAGHKEVTTPDGRTAIVPAFKKNDNGGTPVSVKRFKALVDIFAPEMNDYEWITDAARSAYGTNEAANPIVVVADHALRGNRVGIGKVTLSTRSERNIARLDLLDFVPPPEQGGVVPGQAPTTTVPMGRKSLHALYDAIRDYVADAFVAGSGEFPAFSEAGKVWARTIMLPIWDELGLPANHMVADLTEQQADALLGALLEKVGWPKKSAVSDF